MKKIFVAGKNGQVALSLKNAADAFDVEVACFGRPEINLVSKASTLEAIEAYQPDAIINAAAYTAVDKAEDEEHEAYNVNSRGAEILARAAADLDIPFLHISTDYVFDGAMNRPYQEKDETGPTGAYGRSKLAGEKAVMTANTNAMIFRTAWVYSPYGNNFLKTMLRLAETRDTIGVVADQVGNPSYAPDIARGLLNVLAKIEETGWDSKYAGLYHLGGTGDTSWHGFASAIFEAASVYGRTKPTVNAITTEEFPTPAKRPANSRLNCDKAHATFGVRLADWRKSTADCVRELLNEKG
ncbi:dTDP-4-dehydrorhamnose reductase [Kordiimonas sp. SCSIO 12610]|nr:dTDP-4-dehydrorhamnose reductase [Kordiimonas sp. SCSIO 12610]